MNKTKLAVIAALIALPLLVGLLAYSIGQRNAVGDLTFVRVTPDQISQAMREDHFFSDYNNNILIIQGTVSSIKKNGNNLIVELKTSRPLKVACDLGNQSFSHQVSDEVTVSAIAAHAERTASAVMLHGCTVL
ncbi:MAG: hypothetical protein IVW57_11365 [Ktedonobacterales bacterium]|nr:hypothetical protein [Ktedonobacterales bacterium]